MVISGAVSPIARDKRDNDAGQDAAHGIGQNMIAGGLPFGGAEGIGGFSHAGRDGADRFSSGNDNDG